MSPHVLLVVVPPTGGPPGGFRLHRVDELNQPINICYINIDILRKLANGIYIYIYMYLFIYCCYINTMIIITIVIIIQKLADRISLLP